MSGLFPSAEADSPFKADSPVVGVSSAATLACIWEVTAPKPGNVYRGADFDDLTYVDFLNSAVVVGPVLEQVGELGVGATVLEAVRQTRLAVATNTNLGILLLLAPLAAMTTDEQLAQSIEGVLNSLTEKDAEYVFAAIRLVQPGGLGKVDRADVNDESSPQLTLVEAMQLAADRDLVAQQYTNNFAQVFEAADQIEATYRSGVPLSEAIVYAFLELLARYPDSLITRKCGKQTAQQVSTQAAAVLAAGKPCETAYIISLREFDFSLRVDGHRRNPGTTADLICAALFVLLRENRLDWPVRFYQTLESPS